MQPTEIYNENFISATGQHFIIRALKDDKEIAVAINLTYGDESVNLKVLKYTNDHVLKDLIDSARLFAENFKITRPVHK